jgi:two-component system, response regulator PdtaR
VDTFRRRASLLTKVHLVHAYIIEDEYLIARFLQDTLEDFGFTSFSFARSEDTAVMGAREHRIDLITADIRLLPGDGLKAVEAICQNKNIPVVFITGYAPEVEERLGERVRNAIVLQKPVKRRELEAAVRKLLSVPSEFR